MKFAAMKNISFRDLRGIVSLRGGGNYLDPIMFNKNNDWLCIIS